MVHASTQQLIRKLYELTDAGALAWRMGEREVSRLETEGYVVELEPAPPVVRLLRADGRILERAEPEALAAIAWPDGEGTYASRVTEMATRANRFARGAEPVSAKPLSAIPTPPLNPPRPKTVPTLASFGKTQSFVVKQPASRPAPVAAPPPMLTSLSARSIQTPRLATPSDVFQQNASPASQPPAPVERGPGPHIYKPWK